MGSCHLRLVAHIPVPIRPAASQPTLTTVHTSRGSAALLTSLAIPRALCITVLLLLLSVSLPFLYLGSSFIGPLLSLQPPFLVPHLTRMRFHRRLSHLRCFSLPPLRVSERCICLFALFPLLFSRIQGVIHYPSVSLRCLLCPPHSTLSPHLDASHCHGLHYHTLPPPPSFLCGLLPLLCHVARLSPDLGPPRVCTRTAFLGPCVVSPCFTSAAALGAPPLDVALLDPMLSGSSAFPSSAPLSGPSNVGCCCLPPFSCWTLLLSRLLLHRSLLTPSRGSSTCSSLPPCQSGTPIAFSPPVLDPLSRFTCTLPRTVWPAGSRFRLPTPSHYFLRVPLRVRGLSVAWFYVARPCFPLNSLLVVPSVPPHDCNWWLSRFGLPLPRTAGLVGPPLFTVPHSPLLLPSLRLFLL